MHGQSIGLPAGKQAISTYNRLGVVQEAGQQRFQVQDLAPVLQPLLAALFTAFDKPDSAENEYIMRCIMRVIGFVGPEVILFKLPCTVCLSWGISYLVPVEYRFYSRCCSVHFMTHLI